MPSVSPNIKLELQKAWRLGTSFFRARPDFLLPGAPKCATSSLYDWLSLHPMVRRASRKEPANFIHYPTSELRSRMHFPPRIPWSSPFITGEASVEYFSHPHAAKHIRDIFPQVRLLFMLRDPVQRAWSDYCMFIHSNVETEDFNLVIERSVRWFADPDTKPLVSSALKNTFSPVRYLANGLYAEVLSRWFQYFSPKQCLIVFQEDLLARPEFVQAQVLRHLQLPLTYSSPFPYARKGCSQETMRPETRALLKHFYREPNERLEDLLHMKLPWCKYD